MGFLDAPGFLWLLAIVAGQSWRSGQLVISRSFRDRLHLVAPSHPLSLGVF